MSARPRVPVAIINAARRLPVARAEAARLGLPLTADALRTKPPVPESQNAAPLYRRIHTLLEADRKRNAPAWDAYLKPTRTEKDRIAARAVVQRLAPALNLARQAAARPRCDYARAWEQGVNLVFSEYSSLHRLVRLLSAQALLQMDAGDPLAAVETLRVGGVTCRHLNDPVLFAFLIRVALAAILNNSFVELLNRFGDRADVLTAAESANAAYDNLTDLTPTLRGEIWYGVWVFAEYRTGRMTNADLFEGLDNGETPIKAPRVTPATRGAYADAWETRFLECYNRIYAEARRPGSTPRTHRLFAQKQVKELQGQYDGGDASYMLPAFWIPELGQSFLMALRGLAEIRLRRVALSALHWHLKTGQYPDALPFTATDPFTDTPLRYRRDGADGFMVYSVSANGRDDGGDSTHDTASTDTPYYPKDISLTIHRAR